MRIGILTSAVLLALAPAPGSLAQVVAPVQPIAAGETLLLVEAEGYAEQMPDTLLVRTGVASTGRSAEEALAANNRGMQRIFTSLEALDVSPDDVASLNLRVEPQYPDDRADEDDVRIIGYSAENSIEIAFDDFSRAEQIISALFDAGANQVSGPHFQLRDEVRIDAAKAAAQRDAVQRARHEADTYAEALGMRVSRVLRVADRSLDNDRYETMGNAIRVSGSRIPPTPLRPMPIQVTQEVYIGFALVSAE
jgi:uncharacterized protein YggE